MEAVISESKRKNYYKLINVLSIAIPVVVAVLLGLPARPDLGVWTKDLPLVNAVINSLTAVLLITGLILIRQKNIRAHRNVMLTAFVLGAFFLISYVTYHLTHASTRFGGQGWVRTVYYFLLITHIILSIVVVRFVLMAVYYALSNQIEKHKKTVRWAYPVWLYVSVTGVIVYWLISPYYT